MLCQNCPHRETCTSLCEQAEKYVSQDYTSCRESYFEEGDVSEVFENKAPREWPEFHGSKKDLIITMYFVDQLNQWEIVDKTGISKGYVSKVVKAALNKLRRI